jgi:hypothetical protein
MPRDDCSAVEHEVVSTRHIVPGTRGARPSRRARRPAIRSQLSRRLKLRGDIRRMSILLVNSLEPTVGTSAHEFGCHSELTLIYCLEANWGN